jgi:hypothetical protein
VLLFGVLLVCEGFAVYFEVRVLEILGKSEIYGEVFFGLLWGIALILDSARLGLKA